LEDRMTPSTACDLIPLPGLTPPPADCVVAPGAPANADQSGLDGQVVGTYRTEVTNPDVGATQTLVGVGVFEQLGEVQVSGTLHTPGFIREGRTPGTLQLSNEFGTVTVQLVGQQPQPGFTPPPDAFDYTIVGGTGAYAGISGQGVATLQETPEQRH